MKKNHLSAKIQMKLQIKVVRVSIEYLYSHVSYSDACPICLDLKSA